MERRLFLSLITASLARAQQAAPQTGTVPAAGAPTQGGFTIAGVVVNAPTNTPIAKALVQITVGNGGPGRLEVVTGSDGKFSFMNLPADRFVLRVTRQGGVPQAYLSQGANRGGFSSAVVTGPDQDTANLVFRFHPPGTLSGTILDENTDPVRNAKVDLFTHEINQYGHRHLVSSASNFTRTSGHFRFDHLSAGTYIVGVSGRPWYAQTQYRGPGRIAMDASGQPIRDAVEVKPDPQFDVAYPFTYYPNALDPTSASPVTVTEGNDSAIQINLHTVPSIHVHLVDGTAKAGVGTSVMVAVVGPEGQAIPLQVSGTAQNGQGELTSIAAGRYELTFNNFPAPPVRGEAANRTTIRMTAGNKKIVDLVDGMTVDLNATSRLSVSAEVKLQTESDHPGNRIGLQLYDDRTENTVSVMAGADNKIQFPVARLTPGRYELLLSNTPLFRILAVEGKGAKVSGTEVVIEDNAEVHLSVLIGRRAATTVAGYAFRETIPVAGILVILLPKEAGLGLTPSRYQTDSDGGFLFKNVSAGIYDVVAIEDGFDLAFGEASVIQPYLASAVPLTVNASAPPLFKVPVQRRAG